MKKRPFSLMVAVVAVSGCVTTGNPRGAEGSPGWWRSANQEQRIDYVTRRCSGYGFADGTPEKAQCISNEYRSVNASTEAAFDRFQGSLQRMSDSVAAF